MIYQAMYKCRLCGETFGDFYTGKTNAMIIAVKLTFDNFFSIKSLCGHRHIIHDCKDGSLGFADFQGFKKSEGDNEEKQIHHQE